jgi:hypothetical protein
MQHSGARAFGDKAYLIDHHEMMRILGRVPPVETQGRHEKAAFGRSAYGMHKAAARPRPMREASDTIHEAGPRRAEAPREVWALAPNTQLVSKALAKGRGPALVAQWDELTRTAPWSGIAASFGAAQAARPGGALAEKHRARAASGGFDIVTAAQCVALRSRLLGATEAAEQRVDLDL